MVYTNQQVSLMEDESTITERGQTTVPSSVRKALRLSKGDKLHYILNSQGEVVLSKSSNDSDPVISSFVSFLADDIKNNPERLQTMNPDLLSSIESLVGNVDVDLEAPLLDEDE